MEQNLNFENVFQNYRESNIVESNCADIIFINVGTDTVSINGFALITDATLSIEAQRMETNRTKFNAVFAGASSDQNLLVIRKIYRK